MKKSGETPRPIRAQQFRDRKASRKARGNYNIRGFPRRL